MSCTCPPEPINETEDCDECVDQSNRIYASDEADQW